jgi:hypothetical protein
LIVRGGPSAKSRGSSSSHLERIEAGHPQVRPHEALGMQTPASLYEPSREYPALVPEPEYPPSK